MLSRTRLVKRAGVIGYPSFKLRIKRLANLSICRLLFGIPLNDTTNAFKAYRCTVIQGREPLISPHFNLTVGIPLKAIVRGYSWSVVPSNWRNRRYGTPTLKLKEMGSRHLFICAYVWLEKHLGLGDFKKCQ